MKKIYLIKSDSFILLNKTLKEIINDSENVTKFSLNDSTIYDVIDDASYFGMMEGNRIIIVDNVKYFGGNFLYEEEVNSLINFLTNIDDLTIVFICNEIKKTKDATKRIINLKAEVIDLTASTPEEIEKLITDYCDSIKIKIDKKTINTLLTNATNNIDIVIQEINKFSNITDYITEDIIDKYGYRMEEYDTFAFSNAVIAKNFDEAFNLLDKFLQNGIDAYTLVGILASSFANMYMVKDAVANGLNDLEIANALGYSNEKRVYVMKKNSRIYTLDNLKEIILSLSDLDKKIKTGYNPVYAIKEFLLNL